LQLDHINCTCKLIGATLVLHAPCPHIDVVTLECIVNLGVTQTREARELAAQNENESMVVSADDTAQDDASDDVEMNANNNDTASHAQFLAPGDPRADDRVALTSYPRSGNSLLRRLIESLTGVVTGSDSDPQRTLIKQLTQMGMQGTCGSESQTTVLVA
jgi:hypothetical protein